MAAALDGRIVDEMQLRHDAQLDAVRQLAAQKAAGVFQTLLRFSVFAIQTSEKNLGMRIIARHFHAGDGHQTHTRVVDLQANQLGYFTLDLLGDAISSCKVGHGYLIASKLQGARNLNDFVGFELVAHDQIVVIFQRQAAFEIGFNFFYVILEAFQRIQFTVVDHHVVAQHAHPRTAPDHTFQHVATGDRAHLGNGEHLAHFDHAHDAFPLLGSQHAGQRSLDLVHHRVDDVVVADVHTGRFG